MGCWFWQITGKNETKLKKQRGCDEPPCIQSNLMDIIYSRLFLFLFFCLTASVLLICFIHCLQETYFVNSISYTIKKYETKKLTNPLNEILIIK